MFKKNCQDLALTYHGRFQVDEHSSRNVLAGARLAEEGVERVVASSDRLVARHLTVGLDAVLEAIQLPAGVAHLETALADVYGDAFTLKRKKTALLYWRRLITKTHALRN